MGIGYLLLVLFGAYAALKFYSNQKQIEKDLSNRGALQPGVSYYCNLAVSQRPAQVLASQNVNSDMATPAGYAPAFGPTENMPPQSTEVWF
jgi:hypothetical protein